MHWIEILWNVILFQFVLSVVFRLSFEVFKSNNEKYDNNVYDKVQLNKNNRRHEFLIFNFSIFVFFIFQPGQSCDGIDQTLKDFLRKIAVCLWENGNECFPTWRTLYMLNTESISFFSSFHFRRTFRLENKRTWTKIFWWNKKNEKIYCIPVSFGFIPIETKNMNHFYSSG